MSGRVLVHTLKVILLCFQTNGAEMAATKSSTSSEDIETEEIADCRLKGGRCRPLGSTDGG